MSPRGGDAVVAKGHSPESLLYPGGTHGFFYTTALLLSRIFTSLKQTGVKEGKPPSSSSSSSSPSLPAASPFAQRCRVRGAASSPNIPSPLGFSQLENPGEPLWECPGSWGWEISIREIGDALQGQEQPQRGVLPLPKDAQLPHLPRNHSCVSPLPHSWFCFLLLPSWSIFSPKPFRTSPEESPGLAGSGLGCLWGRELITNNEGRSWSTQELPRWGLTNRIYPQQPMRKIQGKPPAEARGGQKEAEGHSIAPSLLRVSQLGV